MEKPKFVSATATPLNVADIVAAHDAQGYDVEQMGAVQSSGFLGAISIVLLFKLRAPAALPMVPDKPRLVRK